MAEKCALCGEKIQTTFLEKIHGTSVRNMDGKKFVVCSACQQKHKDEDLRKLV